MDNNPGKWTQEEDNILITRYNIVKKSLIMKLLPKRSWKSIKRRAIYLRITGQSVSNKYYKVDKNTVKLKIRTRGTGTHSFIFDKSDYKRVKNFTWYVNTAHEGRPHAVAKSAETNFKTLRLSRFIMEIPEGSGSIISFKDGNTLNCKKNNLLIGDRSLVRYVNEKPNKNNSLGIKGVYYDKKKDKYRVEFRINGKLRYFGIFKELREAKSVAKNVRAKIISGDIR